MYRVQGWRKGSKLVVLSNFLLKSQKEKWSFLYQLKQNHKIKSSICTLASLLPCPCCKNQVEIANFWYYKDFWYQQGKLGVYFLLNSASLLSKVNFLWTSYWHECSLWMAPNDHLGWIAHHYRSWKYLKSENLIIFSYKNIKITFVT